MVGAPPLTARQRAVKLAGANGSQETAWKRTARRRRWRNFPDVAQKSAGVCHGGRVAKMRAVAHERRAGTTAWAFRTRLLLLRFNPRFDQSGGYRKARGIR